MGGVYFSKFNIIIFILFSKKQKNLFKICMLWNVRKFFNNTIRSEMQQVFGGKNEPKFETREYIIFFFFFKTLLLTISWNWSISRKLYIFMKKFVGLVFFKCYHSAPRFVCTLLNVFCLKSIAMIIIILFFFSFFIYQKWRPKQ